MKASRWACALALACATLLSLSSVALGSAPGDLLWARTATGHSIYYAVAAARDGGVYTVGESHRKPNTAKVLVVRRAANGSTRWSRRTEPATHWRWRWTAPALRTWPPA